MSSLAAARRHPQGCPPQLRWEAGSLALPEALDEQAVPQTAVADGERFAAELGEHGADDAGAGKDDVRAIGLQAGEVPALIAVAGAVELDLPIDLGTVEDRAVDDVVVVGGEPVLDGGEVRDGAPH